MLREVHQESTSCKMKWTLHENQVVEQGNVCDACKMQIENHKTTRTPAWRAAGGTVCALSGTVEYLLQGFVNVVDICKLS